MNKSDSKPRPRPLPGVRKRTNAAIIAVLEPDLLFSESFSDPGGARARVPRAPHPPQLFPFVMMRARCSASEVMRNNAAGTGNRGIVTQPGL